MVICLSCYKKLERKMFSPFDYVRSGRGNYYLSTCCNARVKWIDGREYHKIVREQEDQRRLQNWCSKATASAVEGE